MLLMGVVLVMKHITNYIYNFYIAKEVLPSNRTECFGFKSRCATGDEALERRLVYRGALAQVQIKTAFYY